MAETTPLCDALIATTEFIKPRLGGREPRVGLILGSGLGGFADTLTDPVAIDYADIPHFPTSTVTGHAGRLVIGEAPPEVHGDRPDARGLTCVAMQGRVHGYEDHPASVVAYPVRALVALGARTLIITNAAGGLREDWEPGTLMLIEDHINLTGDNPLRGANDDRLGPRFPDMTMAYDPLLRRTARDAAARLGIDLRQGVYAGLSGPSYETPAEIRMLRTLGAHAVGMSTVFEVIAARHLGAFVLGISCITNYAAGITDQPLDHAEVTGTAARVRDEFQGLLRAILGDLSRPPKGGEEPA